MKKILSILLTIISITASSQYRRLIADKIEIRDTVKYRGSSLDSFFTSNQKAIAATKSALENPLITSTRTSGLPDEAGSPIIVSDALAYNAFPALVVDNLGRLHVFYLSGTNHTSADAIIKHAISANAGATWRTVDFPMPQTYSLDIHATKLSNGKLALMMTSLEANNTNVKLYIAISEDNGETFNAPILITDDYLGGIFGTDLVEDNGILYVPAYVFLNSSTNLSSVLFRSTDLGTTWSSAITIASNPATESLNETTIVKYRNSLVAFIREEATPRVYRTTSADNGLTWSARVNVTPPGYQRSLPDVIVVGELLHMIYRSTTQGMNRAVSYDGGLTWNASVTVETTSQGFGYEHSETVVHNGLLIAAYSMDRTALTNADVRIRTYNYYSLLTLAGALIGNAAIEKNTNGTNELAITNTNTGTNAATQLRFGKSTAEGEYSTVSHQNSGYTSFGGFVTNSLLIDGSAVNGIVIMAHNASGPIRFFSGGFNTANERFRILSGGGQLLFTASTPATPAAGTVVEWFDGTNKRWKKSDGTTGIIY